MEIPDEAPDEKSPPRTKKSMDKRVLHHQRAVLLSNPAYLPIHAAELEGRRKNKEKQAARDARKVDEVGSGKRKGKRSRSKGQDRGNVRKKRNPGSAPGQEQVDTENEKNDVQASPVQQMPLLLNANAQHSAHIPSCAVCALVGLPENTARLQTSVNLGAWCPRCPTWWCGLCRYLPQVFHHIERCK